MKPWFTLILNGPKPGLNVTNTPRNTVGDYVPWDRPATLESVMAMATQLSPHCRHLSLFRGKDPGHEIATWGTKAPESVREQRDALWGVLNAIRCAVKFDNLNGIKELLPRIEEVLADAMKELP